MFKDKQTKYAIRKLNVGVTSISMGIILMLGSGINAQATETGAFTSEDTQLVGIEKEKMSTDNVLTELEKQNGVFNNYSSISGLSKNEQDWLVEILLTNFETQADDVAMSEFATPVTRITNEIRQKYWFDIVNQLRIERQLPVSQASQRPEENLQLVKDADAMTLAKANAEITQNDELEMVAADAKTSLAHLLDKGLIIQEEGLTISQLKQDLPALYRGVLFLQQQYGFEKDLIDTLVFEPHTISNIVADTSLTPYQRLRSYGGTKANDARLGGLLKQAEKLFVERRIGEFTGTTSIGDLIEKLAEKQGKAVNDYYKEQTQAIVGETSGQEVYRALKENRPDMLLPILSQGKGLYVGIAQRTLAIGMLESYTDQQPAEKLIPKERGIEQPQTPFFMSVLQQFDYFMNFLNSANKSGQAIPFVTATDTMNHQYNNGIGTWSQISGSDAAEAVKRFFQPMRMVTPYKKSGVGIGGQSTGPNSFIAFETRLMDNRMYGVELFTHEMTHSNDEAVLFGGKYGNHGRRIGQGPELYARGLFEAIDNTQGTSPYKPVFSINTALEIAKTMNRVQNSQPLDTTEKVEVYMRNLMDLIAYLEVKEAEVALEILTPEEKELYFNRVSQVSPLKYDGSRQLVEDTERINANSTNDRFMPYGKLGNETLSNPTTISELVDKNAVSGQFIPRGVSPFIGNLNTNQYDHVPLLESYYAGSVQDCSKNTIGDVSFKRRAYEILGWQGWNEFVKFVGDSYSSDIEAYKDILDNDTGDYAQFKKAQYDRLSKMMPINNLWNEEELKEDLATAIRADLEKIKVLKESTYSILENWTGSASDERVLSDISTKLNFTNLAVQVRNVKLGILNTALNENELMSSVLQAKKAYSKMYNPKGVEVVVNVGEKIEPHNFVENFEALPKDTTVDFTYGKPSTATPIKPGRVIVTVKYPDNSIDKVHGLLTVIGKLNTANDCDENNPS